MTRMYEIETELDLEWMRGVASKFEDDDELSLEARDKLKDILTGGDK